MILVLRALILFDRDHVLIEKNGLLLLDNPLSSDTLDSHLLFISYKQNVKNKSEKMLPIASDVATGDLFLLLAYFHQLGLVHSGR